MMIFFSGNLSGFRFFRIVIKSSDLFFFLAYFAHEVGLLVFKSCFLHDCSFLDAMSPNFERFRWFFLYLFQLVKCLDAHFARIIDIQSLTVGNWNSVITSSIDRTVKVWNINYIFEQVHHIDRHELQIDSVSLSTDAGIAVTVTRNCIGIWDILTGKLKTKLADSALGAIVTHAEVTDSGKEMFI